MHHALPHLLLALRALREWRRSMDSACQSRQKTQEETQNSRGMGKNCDVDIWHSVNVFPVVDGQDSVMLASAGEREVSVCLCDCVRTMKFSK